MEAGDLGMNDDELAADFLNWLDLNGRDNFWTEHGYYGQAYVQEQTSGREQLERVSSTLLNSGQIEPSIPNLPKRPGELPERVKLPDQF